MPGRSPLRCLLSVGSVALVSLTACSGSSTEEASEPPAAVGGPLGTYEVTTRTLELEDPSRDTPTADGGEVSGRDLTTMLLYPTTGDGPFPVVVFSHGYTSTPQAYQGLLAGWASAGFVVAAPEFPGTSEDSAEVIEEIFEQPTDVSFVLTEVLELGESAGNDLSGRIDPERVAAAGHSAGAVTTIGLRTNCCADERIDAEVLLAGAHADWMVPGAPQTQNARFVLNDMPSLYVHGDADESIPLEEGRSIYADTPGPKAFLTLAGATHSAPYNNREHPAFSTVREVTTDFLRWTLQGDSDALDEMRDDAWESTRGELTADDLES